MKTVLALVTAVVLALTVACGGKTTSTPTTPTEVGQHVSTPASTSTPASGRILHLSTGDYAESQSVVDIRAALLSPMVVSLFCKPLSGLSAAEVTATLKAEGDQQRASGSKDAKPIVQAGNPKDELRASEIIVKECDRVLKALD